MWEPTGLKAWEQGGEVTLPDVPLDRLGKWEAMVVGERETGGEEVRLGPPLCGTVLPPC